MSDVTRILSQIEQGDPAAAEQLLPLVYDELRKLAAARLADEQPDQTLQATALVHEAYVRLVDKNANPQWNSRGHFFSAAAEAMRRILVENARRKARVRHGGDCERVELQDMPQAAGPDPEMILAVDEAVSQLAAHDPSSSQLVKLHFFAGLTLEESADAIGVSRNCLSPLVLCAGIFADGPPRRQPKNAGLTVFSPRLRPYRDFCRTDW